MAKIEVEIDDAQLERAAATGRPLGEVVGEALDLLLGVAFESESPEAIARAEESARQYREQVERSQREWEAATMPDVVASRDALLEGAEKFEERVRKHGGRAGRVMRLFFEEKEVETFAWVELVGRARGLRKSLTGFRVDLDNPKHWEAARDYVRALLNRDFHEHWSNLHWGSHRLLHRVDGESEGRLRAEDREPRKRGPLVKITIWMDEAQRGAVEALRRLKAEQAEDNFWIIVMGDGLSLYQYQSYGDDEAARLAHQVRLPVVPGPVEALEIAVEEDQAAALKALRARRPQMDDAKFWHLAIDLGTDLLRQLFDGEDREAQGLPRWPVTDKDDEIPF